MTEKGDPQESMLAQGINKEQRHGCRIHNRDLEKLHIG